MTRPQRIPPPGGLAAFFSCSEGEVAFEHDDFGRGVFFHYVIEGLKGDADLDQDSAVSLPELEAFTKRRVSDFVRAKFDGVRQMPQVINNTRGLMTVASVPNRQTSPPPPVTPPRDTPSLPLAKTITSTATGMKLVLIPAGEYLRGSPDSDKDASADEKPQHRVRITNDFYLGMHEVTQGEWKAVMGTEPWKGKPSVKEGKDYPATYVRWTDANEFCRKLSPWDGRTYRLPTEAEWEYAARGGTTTPYSFGDDASRLSEYAWWGGIVGEGNATTEQQGGRGEGVAGALIRV